MLFPRSPILVCVLALVTHTWSSDIPDFGKESTTKTIILSDVPDRASGQIVSTTSAGSPHHPQKRIPTELDLRNVAAHETGVRKRFKTEGERGHLHEVVVVPFLWGGVIGLFALMMLRGFTAISIPGDSEKNALDRLGDTTKVSLDALREQLLAASFGSLAGISIMNLRFRLRTIKHVPTALDPNNLVTSAKPPTLKVASWCLAGFNRNPFFYHIYDKEKSNGKNLDKSQELMYSAEAMFHRNQRTVDLASDHSEDTLRKCLLVKQALAAVQAGHGDVADVVRSQINMADIDIMCESNVAVEEELAKTVLLARPSDWSSKSPIGFMPTISAANQALDRPAVTACYQKSNEDALYSSDGPDQLLMIPRDPDEYFAEWLDFFFSKSELSGEYRWIEWWHSLSTLHENAGLSLPIEFLKLAMYDIAMHRIAAMNTRDEWDSDRIKVCMKKTSLISDAIDIIASKYTDHDLIFLQQVPTAFVKLIEKKEIKALEKFDIVASPPIKRPGLGGSLSYMSGVATMINRGRMKDAEHQPKIPAYFPVEHSLITALQKIQPGDGPLKFRSWDITAVNINVAFYMEPSAMSEMFQFIALQPRSIIGSMVDRGYAKVDLAKFEEAGGIPGSQIDKKLMYFVDRKLRLFDAAKTHSFRSICEMVNGDDGDSTEDEERERDRREHQLDLCTSAVPAISYMSTQFPNAAKADDIYAFIRKHERGLDVGSSARKMFYRSTSILSNVYDYDIKGAKVRFDNTLAGSEPKFRRIPMPLMNFPFQNGVMSTEISMKSNYQVQL